MASELMQTSVRRGALGAGALDAGLVLAFVLIGRASHGEGLLGVLGTWWPFLGGLVAGWLLLRVWRHPARLRWSGVGVWVCTVVGGLLLRILAGQGVQWSFVIVTTVVLGVFLLGWRALAIPLRRMRAHRGSAA